MDSSTGAFRLDLVPHLSYHEEMGDLKQRAHQAVNRALKKGVLVCPDRCSQCGAGVPLQAHHTDYDQPLVVEWLCGGCHVQRHQELGDRRTREKGDKKYRREAPFSLRVEADTLAAYEAAAGEAGMSRAEWARHVLDVASGVRKIRHVYYIDVGSMSPKQALKHVEETAKKIKDGKW